MSGMVTNHIGRDVQDGDKYTFINRQCTSMKILHMECGGLVIYHIKLELGSFKLPVFNEITNTFQTCWRELKMMVQVIAPDGTVSKKDVKNPKNSSVYLTYCLAIRLIFSILNLSKARKNDS